MRLPAAHLAATLAAVLVLAGCAAEVPTPTPTESNAISTPTPTLVVLDPTVMPPNAYGLACDDLVSTADLSSVFGTPPTRRSSDILEQADLVQDGALVCQWGEPSPEGSFSPRVTIAAAPYGRSGFDALIASYTPTSEGPQVSIAGIGDVAWASCYHVTPTATEVSCVWAVALGENWTIVTLGDMPVAEADLTPVDESRVLAAPRPTSTSALLVTSIVSALGSATASALPAPAPAAPACDALMDWAALSAEFGLPTPSFPSFPPDLSNFGSLTTHGISAVAGERRGAVPCLVRFESYGDLYLDILPGAGWLGTAGARGGSTTFGLFERWEGWGAESCHRSPGGELCQLAGFAAGDAISVNVGGPSREALAARVYDLLAAR